MELGGNHFDRYSRDELARLAPDSTVVVPLGSTEQHGPHLPVCVDAAIVSAIAERAVNDAGEKVRVLLGPTLPFGFSHHHLAFGGTISIALPVYLDVLTEIGKSLVHSGFRRVVFLNGHGGNEAAAAAVLDRLVHELGMDVHVAATSYWTLAADDLDSLQLEVGPVPGHAGGFETSCMLAIQPELVQLEAKKSGESVPSSLADPDIVGARIRRPRIWERSSGRSDDAGAASEGIGEQVLAVVASAVARFLVEFHRSVD